ncbi:MAG: hypothetical protein K8R09_07235 [Desulfobacterales bacterium]|nr:hypothetical protein [Desulfobacterales bacterium]
MGQVFHNVKISALSLVEKLRREGEIKSESQIDIYEELIKGNRYHLDGGDSPGPGYEQFEAIRPQAY